MLFWGIEAGCISGRVELIPPVACLVPSIVRRCLYRSRGRRPHRGLLSARDSRGSSTMRILEYGSRFGSLVSLRLGVVARVTAFPRIRMGEADLCTPQA
jgi:hypothetical protein